MKESLKSVVCTSWAKESQLWELHITFPLFTINNKLLIIVQKLRRGKKGDYVQQPLRGILFLQLPLPKGQPHPKTFPHPAPLVCAVPDPQPCPCLEPVQPQVCLQRPDRLLLLASHVSLGCSLPLHSISPVPGWTPPPQVPVFPRDALALGDPHSALGQTRSLRDPPEGQPRQCPHPWSPCS